MSKHANSVNKIRCIGLAGVLWTLTGLLSHLPAQTFYTVSEELPAKPTLRQRILQPAAGKLLCWTGRLWSTEATGVDSIDVCNRHLILHFRATSQRYGIVIPVDDIDLRFSMQQWVCNDTLLFAQGAGGYYVSVQQGNDRRSIYCTDRAFNDQQVQGQTAWSVPMPATPRLDSVDCAELRTWGILSAKGAWLIPPIFDAPIVFQNGIATVRHYGRDRKINEQGAFVESLDRRKQ